MKIYRKLLQLMGWQLLIIAILLCVAIYLEHSMNNVWRKGVEAIYTPPVMEQADSVLISKIDFSVRSKKLSAVDLGLPSGTKWADRNVGANSPTEYGNLYRYGNPKTKLDGSNNNYANASNIINTQYDVAKVMLGVHWNTPSIEQIKELITYCKSALITLNGKKVMAIIGPNDKFILLPLVGCMFDYGRSQHEMWGLYEAGNWDGDNSFQLVVSDDGGVDCMNSQQPGYYGCAIRAVETEL